MAWLEVEVLKMLRRLFVGWGADSPVVGLSDPIKLTNSTEPTATDEASASARTRWLAPRIYGGTD